MKKYLIPLAVLALVVTGCNKTTSTATKAVNYAGTVSQHAELQAYATLRAARNALDGKKTTDADFWAYGYTAADDAGGKVGSAFSLSTDSRNFYAKNEAVVAANASKFTDATAVDPLVKQLDTTKHATKTVFYDLYNASDNFLSTTYKPLLEKYAKLLNITLKYAAGDGNSESTITDTLDANLDICDAYCINMVRTNDSQTYLDKINAKAANAAKPLVWFNRQPSDPTSGALDTAALTHNDYTSYVGFEAANGGATQGQMIADYITANADWLDKNGDGTLGYVLCIGDAAHNDSIARTKGIRKALGTLKNDSADASTKQEGSIKVGTKTYKVVELEAAEMKNSTGGTWDAATAADVSNTWYTKDGKAIDLCISNNDGMGMSAYNKWAKDAKVPTFGYDANTDAVAAIING